MRKHRERVCKNCGKHFKVKLSRLQTPKSGLFCSRQCYLDFHKVKRYCVTCGKELILRPSEVSNNNYCSPDCCYKRKPWNKDLKYAKVRKELKEKIANTIKTKRRSYKGNLNPRWLPRGKAICTICWQPFEVKIGGKNRKYCSKECFRKARSIYMKNKLGEAKDLYTSAKWKKEIKPLVLKRDNYRCQHCGASNDLLVHHIKSARLSNDNSLENLVTLCKSCHTMIHKSKINLQVVLNCLMLKN